ncbi:MAG: ATP-binding cassette domain-containing protein [Chloroflexi bacterium]|jgi:simple sugar transport system ATP-binding protein|nr:ATP-binding cassette domain-containing protein [Chloroflexota bacterium]
MPPVLELKGITKRFPGVLANDHIDLTLHEGEVLALLGENGAGKSTLMNVLYGLYAQDEGEIYIRGEKVNIEGPNDAIDLGIGMVHQHFMLVPVFTVTENVMLGMESVKNGVFLDSGEAAEKISALSEKYGLNVDPDAMVGDLPVGLQQRVEIIKLLYRSADILILDEPTAVLTPQEVQGLFEVVRSLVSQGKSVIFISHKLKEVLALADNIAVLRGGKMVGTADPKSSTERDLASLMVGREVLLTVEKEPAEPEDVVLEVNNLKAMGDRGEVAVKGISFEVRAGEIVGVAGVQGNGQTELVEVLTGLRESIDGQVKIAGHDVTNASPRVITEQGSAHIPEDRQHDGLVLGYPVAENLILNTYYLPPIAKGMVMQEDKIKARAERLVEEYDVRTPSIMTPVSSLSGGNQQKVIVARELSREVELVIASQPTRGLDVGSIEYIHSQLVRKRDEGAAVFMVSSELDEVLGLADRIIVMFHGEIMDTIPAEEATKEEIGLLMAGVSDAEDAEGLEGLAAIKELA